MVETNSERRARARRATLDSDARLTKEDYSHIRYTQRNINSSFSNARQMNVFEVYFAIKYALMNISELPPIRVFKDAAGLWSVDNRRLWIMKQTNEFHCEGPYTPKGSTSRYKEVLMKRRGLLGGTGQHVLFKNCMTHMCCINAFNQGLLDVHTAEVHLKTTLSNMIELTKFERHSSGFNKGATLQRRIVERCRSIRRMRYALYFPLTKSEDRKSVV